MVLVRRLLLYAAGLAALAALAAALLLGHSSASLDQRTHDVASRLRCPTCVAQSAEDSTSPVADGMRSEIRRQLAAGRSEGQVVDWFRARYGPDIVLVPDRHGLGWALWAAPPAALVAGAVVVVAVQRRRTTSAGGPAAKPALTPADALPTARLALAFAAVLAVGVGVPLLVSGSHAKSGSAASTAMSTTTSSSTSGMAPTAAPSVAADPVGTAFQLLKSGHAKEAESLVAPLAARPGHDRALALLVLGLAQRADDDPAATHTLREFVRSYPHHPAAPQVRRLLEHS